MSKTKRVVNTNQNPKGERPVGAPPVASRPHECLTEDQQKLELSDLYSPSSKWTPEQKVAAVQAYVMTGTSKQAAALCDVPDSTIRWWKMQSAWWDDMVAQTRKERDDQIEAQFTKLLQKAAGNMETRLEVGDEVLDKDGNVNYRAVSARDLATIAAIMYDKQALIRGNPTSKVARSETDALESLSKKFEEFATKMEKRGETAKIIEGERTDGTQ